MNVGKELLFFFSALGAFNGFVLSIYFFFFTKKRYLTNYFLGALLLVLSIRITKSIFLYFDGSLSRIYLQIGLSACFLIGPFLYYFLKSSVNEITTFLKSWKLTLILWGIIILAAGISYPYETYPKLWNQYFARFIYTQWAAYIIASGIILKDVLKKMFNKEYKLTAAETWLLMIFIGNVVIFISYFLTIMRVPFSSYISGSIAFSLILYLIISILLYRKRTDDLFLLTTSKPSNKKINDQDAAIWLKKLEKLMIEQEIYKNPDLKLIDLSKDISISSHQLSQFLNDNLGKNFTTFINEFRINEACKIIASDHRLTLESIGYEVGFNSKSTFFAAFKKLTGTTPFIYQQSAAK